MHKHTLALAVLAACSSPSPEQPLDAQPAPPADAVPIVVDGTPTPTPDATPDAHTPVEPAEPFCQVSVRVDETERSARVLGRFVCPFGRRVEVSVAVWFDTGLGPRLFGALLSVLPCEGTIGQTFLLPDLIPPDRQAGPVSVEASMVLEDNVFVCGPMR